MGPIMPENPVLFSDVTAVAAASNGKSIGLYSVIDMDNVDRKAVVAEGQTTANAKTTLYALMHWGQLLARNCDASNYQNYERWVGTYS